MPIQKVGLISDTHGTIRQAALKALAGCDLIVHAGDVGNSEVLSALRRIAPVFAVRGNIDKGHWAFRLPVTQVVPIGDIFIYVIHNIDDLDLDPAAADLAVVVSGHTHHPAVSSKDDVLYVNPGSAGPSRYDLPTSVALLEIDGTDVSARVVMLRGER